MKDGTKHKQDTKFKISESMKRAWATSGSDRPIDETAVTTWVNGLTPEAFDDFVRRIILPRIKRERG